jgi:hypothetical protein
VQLRLVTVMLSAVYITNATFCSSTVLTNGHDHGVAVGAVEGVHGDNAAAV